MCSSIYVWIVLLLRATAAARRITQKEANAFDCRRQDLDRHDPRYPDEWKRSNKICCQPDKEYPAHKDGIDAPWQFDCVLFDPKHKLCRNPIWVHCCLDINQLATNGRADDCFSVKDAIQASESKARAEERRRVKQQPGSLGTGDQGHRQTKHRSGATTDVKMRIEQRPQPGGPIQQNYSPRLLSPNLDREPSSI